MFLRPILLPFYAFLLLPSISMAGNNNAQNIIKMLNHDIELTQTDKEKSNLLIYRARQYSKIKECEKALEDYNNALELNHKGWIHLERSHLLMKIGKYELAYEDAEAAKEEVPTLAREADKVMDAAVTEVRKIYEADNPLTIIMNSQVDPYRKTRFDLMRNQGVFLAKAKSSRRSTQKTKSKKLAKTACKPTKKRG